MNMNNKYQPTSAECNMVVLAPGDSFSLANRLTYRVACTRPKIFLKTNLSEAKKKTSDHDSKYQSNQTYNRFKSLKSHGKARM